MTKFTLNRYTKQASLAEIGQSMGTKFALLKREGDTFTQITPPVKCRDFLGDVYSSSPEQQAFDFTQYGMSWKGATDSPDWSGAHLLLIFPTGSKENFNSNLKKLHDIEKKNGYTKTKVEFVTDNEAIIIGSSEWLNSSLSFSLYTFLLRVFCYKLTQEDWATEFSGQSHSDSKYLKSIPRVTWDKITNDLSILKMETWSGLDYRIDGTSSLHHNQGAIGILGSHSEQSASAVRKNKHWQYFQSIGLETYIKP